MCVLTKCDRASVNVSEMSQKRITLQQKYWIKFAQFLIMEFKECVSELLEHKYKY